MHYQAWLTENVTDKLYKLLLSGLSPDLKMIPKLKKKRKSCKYAQLHSWLSDWVISTKDYQAIERIWKEEKVRIQNEIRLLKTNNRMLRSSTETLSRDLDTEKAACQFLLKKMVRWRLTPIKKVCRCHALYPSLRNVRFSG